MCIAVFAYCIIDSQANQKYCSLYCKLYLHNNFFLFNFIYQGCTRFLIHIKIYRYVSKTITIIVHLKFISKITYLKIMAYELNCFSKVYQHTGVFSNVQDNVLKTRYQGAREIFTNKITLYYSLIVSNLLFYFTLPFSCYIVLF